MGTTLYLIVHMTKNTKFKGPVMHSALLDRVITTQWCNTRKWKPVTSSTYTILEPFTFQLRPLPIKRHSRQRLDSLDGQLIHCHLTIAGKPHRPKFSYSYFCSNELNSKLRGNYLLVKKSKLNYLFILTAKSYF